MQNIVNPKRITIGILTVILLVFMWSAYPGYVFHTYYLSPSASNRSVTTEVLADSVLTTQYFTPQFPYLKSIGIAVEFDKEASIEEIVVFSIYDESGSELFSCNIAVADMESAMYYDVNVNQKLKPGQTYYWSLVSPTQEACNWKVMYAEHAVDCAPENQYFLVGDNLYGVEGAQTISQYEYYSHHDKVVIIAGYWGMGLLVYIVCLEIVNRVFKDKM